MSNMTEAAEPQDWTSDDDAVLAALVARHRAASGGLMRAVGYLGGRAENMLDRLPQPVRTRVNEITESALRTAYATARMVGQSGLPDPGPWANTAAVTVAGAAGGAGGLPTALLELPVTIATMFGAIQRVAARHGFHPDDPDTRLACLSVFASGGPLDADDGSDSSFLASRVMITGATLQAVIATVVPRFGLLLGQKLAAQSMPVLGAFAGAGVNLAFIRYFEAMAEVRFGLARLSADRGRERVTAEFRRLAKTIPTA